ncbi:MAG: hypothetical protein COA78_31525 [Blastopirellula sp.]|nr:MAG: hypothetical protein COA78_31525 [Blastopirellula sp.]
MKNRDSSRLLRASLFSNSVFSALSGLCFISASGPLSSLIGLKVPEILIGIGISLVVFAARMTLNARRPSVNLMEAWITVVFDLVWVVASAIVIFTGLLTTTGNWAVAIIAGAVLVFAVLQFQGLRKIRHADSAI